MCWRYAEIHALPVFMGPLLPQSRFSPYRTMYRLMAPPPPDAAKPALTETSCECSLRIFHMRRIWNCYVSSPVHCTRVCHIASLGVPATPEHPLYVPLERLTT